ncbi:MAG: hypothetical protein BWY31_00177 [Lentisphaerae bacterium ADurb.Bin242]|nr:MAG: hypothetical protein BWY31_00177 [Lentisphaerae bacterium ADurb.Bin242]
MKTMQAWILAGTLLLPFGLSADMTLVRDGKPEAAIVLEEKPTASAQMGAFELQHNIRLITGATLPIVRGEAPKDTLVTIRVGGENQGLTGEANRIQFSKNKILLTGNDSADYKTVNYKNHATFPPINFSFKGSLYAVYDFLEHYCGVHFYYMDESGTTFKERKTLTIREKDRTFTPPLDAFRVIYDDDSQISKFRFSPRDRALWQLRWRLNDTYGMTSHNQYSIFFAHWDKAKDPNLASAFKGKNEALFAKGFKGKSYHSDSTVRKHYPNDPDLPPQLCYSNPDAVKYYANEVITYFKGGNVPGGWLNPNGSAPAGKTLLPRMGDKPWFYPIQGGDTGGHCLCADCKKRFPQDNRENISNNKFQFIADVAREAAKTHPAAGVSSLAYIQTLDYPDGVVFPDNVSVQLCLPVYSWWHPVAYEKQFSAYRKWMEKEGKKRPITLWTYLFSTYWDSRFHFGKYKPFPGLYPWKTGEIFQMFTRDGVRGWFTEVELQYNHLEAYVAAKICYDPSLDPNRILEDYFTEYYGDAGPVMKEFYKEIENAYWSTKNCPAAWLQNEKEVIGSKGRRHPYWTTGLIGPDYNWKIGSPERVKKLNDLIEKAKTLVKTPNEKIRLQRIIDGIWKNTLEGQREYELLKIRKTQPPRSLSFNRGKDAGGDPEKIDWSQAPATAEWVGLSGEKTANACSMRAAADSEYLYLNFHDPKAYAGTPLSIWQNDLEIFFADGGKYPVLQLAFSPKGEKVFYRYRMVNDSQKTDEFDPGVKVISRTDEKGWSLLLSVPLKNLPVRNSALRANFLRTTPDGNLCWTPIYIGSYLGGIDMAGTLEIFPLTIQETAFACYRKGVDSALVDDPAASDGKAAEMNGNAGWSVSYTLPENFQEGKYRIFACLRSEAAPEPDLSHNLGVYDSKTKKTVGFKKVMVADIAGKEYKTIDLGVFPLKGGQLFFVGGLNKKIPVNKIYIDFLRFEKAE